MIIASALPVTITPGPSTKPASILVVDDDAGIRELLKTAIEWRGHEALLARNGVEALAMCAMRPDVDVIVCDIEMPVMGGLAFIEKVQRLKPDARIIACTGGQLANLNRAESFNIVRATLSKPYSIPLFWETLERVLE